MTARHVTLSFRSASKTYPVAHEATHRNHTTMYTLVKPDGSLWQVSANSRLITAVDDTSDATVDSLRDAYQRLAYWQKRAKAHIESTVYYSYAHDGSDTVDEVFEMVDGDEVALEMCKRYRDDVKQLLAIVKIETMESVA